MASPTPPTTANSRWARSTEPGSAFSGLTRPNRGRGGPSVRGGGRGGGGGGGGRSAPPTKTDDSTPPVAPKPKASSSRRSSRANPPPVVTQLPAADVPASPLSARPASSRRRRSQAAKTTAAIPPRINPPAPSDALLRPNKPRLPAPPHTAPVKDTPPHLVPHRSDIRTDIDALVERVRASAMDHRPSTPGSHIDWAGDDDDSLPDLDDWGVNPAVFAASKEDTISPIILDGLRPLPDLAAQSYHASPLRQAQEVDVPPPEEVKPPVRGPNPLHPSLPARPVDAVSPTPLKAPFAATPMRATPTPKIPKPAEEETPPPEEKPPASDPMEHFHAPDGLAASIHAPKPGDPVSAPAAISTYPDPDARSLHAPAHTRTQTVGRPFPRHPAPRSGAAHARTHSNPPAGAGGRPPHATRPVLTTGALSRLARTIGSTNGSPNSKAHGVAALGD